MQTEVDHPREVVTVALLQEEVQVEQTQIREQDMDLKLEITLTDQVLILILEEVVRQVIIKPKRLPDLLTIHQEVRKVQGIQIGLVADLHTPK